MKKSSLIIYRGRSHVLLGVLFMSFTPIFATFVSMPSPLLAMFRAAIAWVCLMLFFPDKDQFKLNEGFHYVVMLLAGVLLALSWTLFFEALNWTSVTATMTAYFMFPLWQVVRSFSDLSRFTLLDLVMLIGLLFSAYLLVPEWSIENPDTYGIMLAFLAASLAVFQRWISESVIMQYDLNKMQCFQWGIAALVLIPYGFVFDVQLVLSDVLWVVLLGAICTFFSQELFFNGILYMPINFMSMIFSIQPVIAMGLAVLFLSEKASSLGVAAAIFVSFLGVFFHFIHHFLSPDYNKPKNKGVIFNERMRLIDLMIQERNRPYEK